VSDESPRRRRRIDTAPLDEIADELEPRVPTRRRDAGQQILDAAADDVGGPLRSSNPGAVVHRTRQRRERRAEQEQVDHRVFLACLEPCPDLAVPP
jgi:hypothetical protein